MDVVDGMTILVASLQLTLSEADRDDPTGHADGAMGDGEGPYREIMTHFRTRDSARWSR